MVACCTEERAAADLQSVPLRRILIGEKIGIGEVTNQERFMRLLKIWHGLQIRASEVQSSDF